MGIFEGHIVVMAKERQESGSGKRPHRRKEQEDMPLRYTSLVVGT